MLLDVMFDTVSKRVYGVGPMTSSGIRFAPFPRVGGNGLEERSAVVVPGAVEAAKIDRLEWIRDPRTVRSPAPGVVDPAPVATGALSTLHLASDRSGLPCLVRRSSPEATPLFSIGQEIGSTCLQAVDVPDVVGVHGGDVWMDRLGWAPPGTRPAPAAVDDYVTGVVREVLDDGVMVGTGEMHVGPLRNLICEDVVIASRLEIDQRILLRAVVLGLAAADPVQVADAVSELCRLRTSRLVQRSVSCVRSLEVRWDSVAFGLAIHGLGRAVLDAGVRSEPLVLLGDELLHRLDLGHEHRVSVSGLATPDRVVALANGAAGSA